MWPGSPDGVSGIARLPFANRVALGRFWLFSLFFAAKYQPSDNC
jgi:hypothetical protein